MWRPSWLAVYGVALGIAIFFAGESFGNQRSASDRALVVQAIGLSGEDNDLGELPDTITRVYTAAIKSQRPGISKQTLDEISESVKAYVAKRARETDLQGQLVAIYQRHLSPDDVAAVVAFLSSKAGRRYTAAMPGILQESGELGKRWTESINPGVRAVISKHLQPRG